jgi:hypothetical protein
LSSTTSSLIRAIQSRNVSGMTIGFTPALGKIARRGVSLV